jgi:hypothetical protein
MKTYARSVLALAALLPLGCGSLTAFDIDLPADGALPSSIAMPPQAPAYSNVGNTMSQTLSSKGVSSFKSATVASGSFSVPANLAKNMKYITSFKIEIAAPNLPTVQIAHQDGSEFAKQVASVPLIIDGVELKPYFAASQVTFNATPVFSGRPIEATPLHVDLKVHVQVL